MGEKEWLDTWVARAVALYPQIEEVWLVGSRAQGVAHEASDYDVLVYLEDACYDADSRQIGKIEQRLAFDTALRWGKLDLFFARPAYVLGRWAFGPDDEPPEVAGERDDYREYAEACLRDGVPEGDWSRFYRDLVHAQQLYRRES